MELMERDDSGGAGTSEAKDQSDWGDSDANSTENSCRMPTFGDDRDFQNGREPSSQDVCGRLAVDPTISFQQLDSYCKTKSVSSRPAAATFSVEVGLDVGLPGRTFSTPNAAVLIDTSGNVGLKVCLSHVKANAYYNVSVASVTIQSGGIPLDDPSGVETKVEAVGGFMVQPTAAGSFEVDDATTKGEFHGEVGVKLGIGATVSAGTQSCKTFHLFDLGSRRR